RSLPHARRSARARPTRRSRTGCASRATARSSRTASKSAEPLVDASASLIALTAGEPAGIGPDLCALLAAERFAGRLVVLGDREVLRERARERGLAFDVPDYPGRANAPALSVLHMPCDARVTPGTRERANGP